MKNDDHWQTPHGNLAMSLIKRHFFTEISKNQFDNLFTDQNWIGSGAQGDVYSAIHEGQMVAIKFFKKQSLSADYINYIQHEIEALHQIRHQNILSLISTYQVVTNQKLKRFCIITEFCDFSLNSINKIMPLSQLEKMKIAYQLVSGINAIHKCGYMHRDIKPENVLIKNMGYMSVKIGDFGCSRFQIPEINKTIIGTPIYADPNIQRGEYSMKCDIYSAGLVIINIFCGRHFFSNCVQTRDLINAREQFKSDIESPTKKFLSSFKQSQLSQPIKSFLTDIAIFTLQNQEKDRLDAAKLLQYIDNSLKYFEADSQVKEMQKNESKREEVFNQPRENMKRKIQSDFMDYQNHMSSPQAPGIKRKNTISQKSQSQSFYSKNPSQNMEKSLSDINTGEFSEKINMKKTKSKQFGSKKDIQQGFDSSFDISQKNFRGQFFVHKTTCQQSLSNLHKYLPFTYTFRFQSLDVGRPIFQIPGSAGPYQNFHRLSICIYIYLYIFLILQILCNSILGNLGLYRKSKIGSICILLPLRFTLPLHNLLYSSSISFINFQPIYQVSLEYSKICDRDSIYFINPKLNKMKVKKFKNYITQNLQHLLIIQMSLHCGFLFPKKDFKLIFMNTIGYISDNVFYRLNLQTLQTEIVHHPQGRSYQAFTACAKRQLVVLVDYGKNPTFFFEYHDSQKSFDVKGICPLEVTRIELSLNGKYLAIVCGTPTPQLIFYDIENRCLLQGSKSTIPLTQNYTDIKRIAFNPGNPKQIAIQFSSSIEIYQLRQFFELDSSENLQQSIIVKKIDTISDQEIETFIWDQINNLYVSNKKEVFIYSTDTKSRTLSCDIQVDHDDDGSVVANMILTRKHIIVFYRIGRVQWLNKYYPESMEEEDAALRPFYLDKYFQTSKQINHSNYDGQMTKIFISFSEGCFGILPKAAQSNETDQQEEETGKKESKTTTEKKVDVDMTFTPYYHASPIVLIYEFPNTAACVTLSSAGRFILWSIKARKQLQTHAIIGDITSASVNKQGNVLATGHSNGIVRFYSIAKPNEIFLFKQFRLVKNGSIDKITFSSNGEQLAVLSKSENRIYYVLTSISMDFEVLGYVQIPFSVKNIMWMGPTKSTIAARYEYLLVTIGFGVLMVNSPPTVPTKKRGKDLDLKLDVYALRTDPNQTLVAGLPTGQIVTTGKDKYIKKYKQPQDLIQKIDWRSKTPPNPPLQQIDGHDFQIELLHHSEHFFLSGGRQGKIQLRDYNNFKDFKEVKAYGWRNNLLSYVLGSWNRGLVFTSGRDGSFYMWKIGEWQVQGEDKVDLQALNFKRINSARQDLKYYELVIEDQYRERNKQKIEQKKKVQIAKLTKIRQELKHLLQENERHEELERLNRDEFAIDLQSKQRVWREGEDLCKKIMEESKKKILVNEIYAKKLKEITWDRMDVHLSAINGLKNNYVVYNYQIRKISAIQKRKVKLILDLRKAQKRQEKKRTIKIIDVDDYNNKNIVNSGFITPLIMTQIEAKKEDNKKDEKKKKKQEEPAQPANQLQEQSQELPAEEQWQLLYSSFELYNSNSKRNQIIMMKNIITLIKKSFNKEFNKLVKFRQNQNQMINDKNKRIVEICQELKRQTEVIVSRDNILESNESVLEVKNSEIPFPRYLSREQRDKLEKQRLKEEERLRKLAEDDSGQRALQKMMGGTLEEKKVSALEITVEKQKWMQKPVEEMSEQEKVKLKQYEQKKQKAEEEKQRIVKKLEAQLRKLKQEIDQIMEKYDEKLFELLKRKIEYDYRIQQQQLYCARLSLTLLDQQEQSKHYQQLQKHISLSKQKLQAMSKNKALLQNHSKELEDMKEQKKQAIEKQRLGEFDSKIKTIEKIIFEEYQTNMKKRREFQEKLLEKYPAFKNLILSLDPFKDIQSKYLSEQVQKHYSYFVHEIKQQQGKFQIPENTIEKLLESRFNLKRQEHQLEQKLKILLSSMENLQQSIQDSNKQINKDEGELQTIEEFLIKCKSDLDIEIRIKQGQVEINSEKPVSDLEDALLIAKGQIDQKNFKIKQEANQKIAVMKEIKTCKIKVTEESLNLEKKQQHIDKLSSMIKEIQMLKVKKQMQVALSKKDAKMNENELKSLKEQIQKVRKQGQKRIALFEQKIKKILKEIQTIKKENKQLETQKWNLQTTVKQRQKIKDMMCGDGESGQEAAEKFSQISINRQLFDKAKQQTEEIELLRQELSKLKAKTFANFSNVQR